MMPNFLKVELILILQATLALCLKTSAVIEKAVHIASSTFALDHATSVVWSVNNIEEVTSFLSSYPGTSVLTSLQYGNSEEIRKLNLRVGYKETVFFASGVNEFTNFLTVLKPDTVVPIRLILVLTDIATVDVISAVTEAALLNDVADIVVVGTRDSERVELFTYFPYGKGICGNHAPVNITSKGGNWFPKKFSNFHGCPIRVTLLHLIPYARLVIENNTVNGIYGRDGRIFMMLMKELNASVDIVSWKDHGNIGTVINGTATGSFGDLVYSRADILTPTIIINYLRYPKAQISPVFETVDVYWFGPHRRQIYDYLRVFQPFVKDVSIFIIASFILFTIVIKLVIRFSLDRVYLRYSVMFQSFIIFQGQGVRFESRSWLVNYLFVMWIWFCMIVRIVYQSELVDGLQAVILESPLKNLRDALKEVDGYGGSNGFRDFYKGTRYYDRYKLLGIEDVVSEMKQIIDGKRFLLAADRLLITLQTNRLQMLEEPITHAPMCFFMRPGWPAAKEIANDIQQLVETGFVQNIVNNHMYKWMKKVEFKRETHPLNKQTLIGCFYGLGILYGVCVLVFTFEILYYKLLKDHHTKKTVVGSTERT